MYEFWHNFDIALTLVSYLQYLEKSYSSYSDFWMIRKRFTLSLSALTFFTYSFNIGQRFLHRLNLNLVSGNIWTSDMFLSKYISFNFGLDTNFIISNIPNVGIIYK